MPPGQLNRCNDKARHMGAQRWRTRCASNPAGSVSHRSQRASASPGHSASFGSAFADRHIPVMAETASLRTVDGTSPVGADDKTRVFRIDLTAEKQFTDDGGKAYPWITGAWACKTCHNGVDSFNLDFPSARTIHE